MFIRYLSFIIICFMVTDASATAQSWQDFMGRNLTAEQREAGEKFIRERPAIIEAQDNVFIENLTWIEVRDAITVGKKTIIIPTGGIEQNGPYVDLNKHNLILRVVTERIATKLGDTLIAPIVPFVPEGNISPPTGHMMYPGTISVSQDTFKALLTDIANSLKQHGFEHIIFIGDSGGNQRGMREVTDTLNQEWTGSSTRAHHIPEYYDIFVENEWLVAKGLTIEKEDIHDFFGATILVMLADMNSVRIKEREEAGLAHIDGIDLLPLDETLKLANELANLRANVTVAAIKASRSEN